MLAQEKLLNEHERKLLLLEQHLGLSLSQTTTSPTTPSNPVVASTSGTTLQPSKRSLEGINHSHILCVALSQNN